jgi:hypothetical protein
VPSAAQYTRWSKAEERLVSKSRLARDKKIRELSRGNLARAFVVFSFGATMDWQGELRWHRQQWVRGLLLALCAELSTSVIGSFSMPFRPLITQPPSSSRIVTRRDGL